MTADELAKAATDAGLTTQDAQLFFARAAGAGRIQELEQKLAAYKAKLDEATQPLRDEMQQLQIAIESERLKLASLK